MVVLQENYENSLIPIIKVYFLVCTDMGRGAALNSVGYKTRFCLGMDRVPNARIRELCRVKKGLNERTDEGFLRWRVSCRRVCW